MKKAWPFLVLAGLLWVIYYFSLPTLNFGFGEIWVWGFITLGTAAVLFRIEAEYPFIKANSLGLGAGVIFLIWLIIAVATSSMFRASEYRNLIGEVEQTEFTSNIAPVSADQMLIVDKDIARLIGEKELGSIPGLGSRVFVGDFNLQSLNGTLYWVAPLEHSGLFKYLRFKHEGTPGYIIVSAINQEDYRLVREQNGKPLKLVYQPSAYFSRSLARHVYMNGYKTKRYTSFKLEIDQTGRPYWTSTLYNSKIGFGGYDATDVLVIDPETGKIDEYNIEQAPKWIDRIQPETFVATQADNWGEYIHGFWNWSGRDKLRACKERSIVMGADNSTHYYIGLQSKGSEQSTVGFMLVNTRTKEAKWFKQSGATETAAKASAEGKVQEKGYVGSDGICYNIGGHATYEFLLKDYGGLMKLVALVKVHDHTIVGVGETRQQAVREYKTALSSRGNVISTSGSDLSTINLESVIQRIAAEVEGNFTNYYLVVKDQPQIAFLGRSSLSIELPLTQVGDAVSLRYIDAPTRQIELIDYRNLSLNLRIDEQQLSKELDLFIVREAALEGKQGKVADQKWEGLSPSEKNELLNKKQEQ